MALICWSVYSNRVKSLELNYQPKENSNLLEVKKRLFAYY